MNQLIILSLSLLITTCSVNQQDNDESSSANNSMKNENKLHSGYIGKWINTAFFDSTLKHKQLYPWLLNGFYGNVLLTITGKDTITLEGNMENYSDLPIKIIDSLSFTVPVFNSKHTFTYLPDSDLILETVHHRKILFRRVKKEDNLEIVGNRQKFNEFFINEFFKDDFFKFSKKPEIVYIWNGFETHTPYNFDAIRIKNKYGKIENLAWIIKGDTLKLYSTSYSFNEDGFAKYKIEGLRKKYIKK